MGCSANPGVASQCANCLDKNNPDIWYCGKQMGWTAEASDVAIHCENGKMVDAPAGCGKDLCHKTCTRTSPPPLPGACCQATPE
jgi:hypothetical protein